MRRVCFVLLVSMLAVILATAVFAVDSPTPVAITFVVEGTVTNVAVTGPSSGSITVQVASTTSTIPTRLLTLAVTSSTQLYRDGQPATLAEIKVGDLCRAMLRQTSTGVLLALVVYAKTPPPPPMKWVSGVIADKALWNGKPTFKLRIPDTTVPMWFSVDGNTKITVNGNPAGYEQLANGQAAQVGYIQPPPSPLTVILPIPASVVNARTVLPPPSIRIAGRLAFVDLAKSVIGISVPTGTAPVLVKVTANTQISKFGPVGLIDLIPANPTCPGDMVEVFAEPAMIDLVGALPVAVFVKVLPETLTGVVAAVDPVNQRLLLVPRNIVTPSVTAIDYSAGVTIRVDSRTTIVRNGEIVPLDKLLKGDLAHVKYFRFRYGMIEGYYNLAQFIQAKGATPIVASLKKR